MTRRAAVACAVALTCAVGGGVAGWRLGWFVRGTARATPAAPAGGEPTAWSATIVRTFEADGRTTSTATQFARSGDRTRLEWTEGDRRMALIVRPDQSVSWLVDLSANTYVETAIDANGAPIPSTEAEPLSGQQVEAAIAAGSPVDGFVVRCERIGEETIDGHACIVYRSRLESLDGTPSEATVWEASDFAGLAIRSEVRGAAGGLVRTELRQLQRNPDAGAFELPPGAQVTGQTP